MYFAPLSAPPLIASSKAFVVPRNPVVNGRSPPGFESFFGFAIHYTLSYSTYLTRLYIQANQNALRVRQIANDLSDRLRQFADQRRYGKNLIAARERRVLHQIDNFNVILPLQILFANVLEVSEGGDRSWGLTGNVKTQVPPT